MSDIFSILKKYDINPDKSFGQNFLIDKSIIKLIGSFFDKEDTVIEIGPGLGSLTDDIKDKVKDITLVELDIRMFEILNDVYKDNQNIKIVNSDILKFNVSNSPFSYKMLGALPYTGSKKIIRYTIERENPPANAYFIIQKEVADKYIYKEPYSILSSTSSLFCEIERIRDIDLSSFYPSPKVQSTLIKITPYHLTQDKIEEYREISRFIKASFITPRKQLINVLSSMTKKDKGTIKKIFDKIRVREDARAEMLGKEDWINLHENLFK